MSKEDNLRPGEYKLSLEEAKKGGIASGEARRKKKNMQEIAKYILSMSLQTGEKHNIEEIQNLAEVKGKNLSVDEAILLKQVEKALKGDINSATFVRDTAGQKPVEQIQQLEPPKIVDDL